MGGLSNLHQEPRRHPEVRPELVGREVGQRLATRQLDYRIKALNHRTVHRPRRARRTQFHRVPRPQAHVLPNAHQGHDGGRAEHADGQAEHDTVIPIEEAHKSPRACWWWSRDEAKEGAAVDGPGYYDPVGLLHVGKELCQ